MVYCVVWRCCVAGDEVDGWFGVVFFGFVSQELCGVFFGRIVDFIDYDDGFGFVVGEEFFQYVDEFCIFDWVIIDVDCGGLVQVDLGGLVNCFIG